MSGMRMMNVWWDRCSLKVSRSQEDDLLAGFANLLDQHLEVLDGEIAVDQELIARATPTTEEIASAPELNVAACKRDLRQLGADKHPSEVNEKRSKLNPSLDTRVEEFENKVDEECDWLWDNWDVERRREANVTPIDSMSFRFSLDRSRDCQLDPPLISSPDDPSLLSSKDPLCISNPVDLPFISNPEDLPCISSPEDVPFIANPEDLRCSSSAEDVPCISSAQEMIENSPLLLPVEEALKIKRKGGLFNEGQRKAVYLETVKYINHKRFPWKQILESLQNQRELDFGNVNPKQIRDCFGNINRKLNR
ncbi:hypothetical protein KC19_2G024900 [Ceratodon purpureus]|uniref:Uncharacterized protein n=1 Tax=Ceratodon purpureus TaxID=3225 RepID=A0A8T0IRF7_CERPU|nr:hypothetical protein KC19_2G024900 [Ceratodon purpureus]